MLLLLSLAVLILLFSGSPVFSSIGGAYKGRSVVSLEVRGLDEGLAKRLAQGLVLSGRFRVYRTVRPDFYPQTLEEDLRRCRLFLAREGYPFATILPLVEPTEKNQRVRVILDIDPGPPVITEQVSAVGAPDFLAAKADSLVSPMQGSRFTEEKSEAIRSGLERTLKEAGYPWATVEAVVDRLDSVRVAVRFDSDPGTRSFFGDVVVQGARPDLVPLVRKTVDLEEGTFYSPLRVERAHDHLRLLGLFRQIRLSVEESGEGRVDLVADLRERRPRTFEVGLGYWTDDLLKGHVRWEHRNLLGRGRGVEVKGTYSRFLQSGGAQFWWPALFGPRTRWNTAGNVRREDEESYNLLSTGIEVWASYRPSWITDLRAGVSFSQVDVDETTDDPDAFVETGGLLTFFFGRWQRDGADDQIYPTRGIATTLVAEWAPSFFLTESHYVLSDLSVAAYREIASGVVAAARVNLGLASPTGGSVDLLPNKRFFAGGASTMRGFKRRKLGPLDQDGAPIGGEARVLLSGEVRFPLFWRFNGALFVDGGQVWERREEIAGDQLEFAVGPGIMVRSPVGPVRADLAFRVTDRMKDQPSRVFHLGIGHPF